MNLCLNAFVIQFPDDFLDTCLVTAPRALLLPFAHRGHCKDEDSFKECSSHVEFSISLTRHKMSDGGRGRALLGVRVEFHGSEESGLPAVRCIAWLDVLGAAASPSC